ncbi:hypothetical protein ABK040_015870 [Willaertia magna]
MMLKVDEVKEGTTTKAFDYTFKSSNNQTYRIILSLFENDTRFTINMTEKTEKICFSTEFTTSERVNQCSKGIFNRIDIFYFNILSIFEKNEADGMVTKDGTFQLILPYNLMKNKVENMIIEVGLVENDEVWRLKQTILDLKEELINLTTEIVSYQVENETIPTTEKLLFTHTSKKRGKVVITCLLQTIPSGTYLYIKIGDKSHSVELNSPIIVVLDGNTDIKVTASNNCGVQHFWSSKFVLHSKCHQRI